MEATAKLRNYPTSPRKMRLLADLIRGQKVENVLAILEHHPKHPAVPLRKLVLSAVDNWKHKNEGEDVAGLIVKTIYVDGGRTLKRMRPAPQGRGYRVRKRSNHVTLIVDLKGAAVIAKPIEEEIKVAQEVTEVAVEKKVKPKEKAEKAPAKKKTVKKSK